MEIPYNWIAHICHVGSSHYCNFIVQSGLTAGGKDTKAGRQIVFFTALDPMNEIQTNETYDVKEPRVVSSRMKWKVYQNAVYWINLKSAQGSGLRFQQTNSNAIILDNSVPADCLEKVVKRKSRRNHASKDSFVVTSATKGFSQECLASSTREHGEKVVADQVTTGPEDDLRFQGVPHEEPQQDEDKWSETMYWKTSACNYASSKQRCVDCRLVK